jgi:hypothetical protein
MADLQRVESKMKTSVAAQLAEVDSLIAANRAALPELVKREVASTMKQELAQSLPSLVTHSLPALVAEQINHSIPAMVRAEVATQLQSIKAEMEADLRAEVSGYIGEEVPSSTSPHLTRALHINRAREHMRAVVYRSSTHESRVHYDASTAL